MQDVNRQLGTAAPTSLRRDVSTFVAAGETVVRAVRAHDPNPAVAMQTPGAQAASRRLYAYATDVCKIRVSAG